MKFFIQFLIDNFAFEKEHILFIYIIRVWRNFKELGNARTEKIYNIPTLYYTVEQLFSDNLDIYEENGIKKMNLKNILQNDIKELLYYINLESEFKNTLKSFVNNTIGNKTKVLIDENVIINQENYYEKLVNYFKHNNNFMTEIIEKAKSYINYKGNDLMKKIYDDKLFNKNSVDIMSIILNFIKDRLLSQYIIDNLEDNNFFTSLLVL